MLPANSSKGDLGLRDFGFVVLALLSAALVLPVQLASVILFDSTGLDTLAPDLVFVVVVPALAVTAPVTALARYWYSPRVGAAVVTVEFLAVVAFAAYLRRSYGMCGGPGC